MAHGPNTAEILRRIPLMEWSGPSITNLRNLSATSLPDLPPTAHTLDCRDNQLTALPALPPGLLFLYCSGNQLTTLPALPPGLLYLHCSGNQLTTLPALPPGLDRLDCSKNQLTTLPVLPPRLEGLDCNENQLTTLPVLPPRLEGLWCNENQLTTLPALPPGLNQLSAIRNPIERVPLPFPPGIRKFKMRDVFADTNLYLPDVTLGKYPQALENLQKARDVRNARLMGEYSGLPHGPESIVASFLSGIQKKNAAQQGDLLKKRAGIAGPAPNRKGYSGGRRRTIRRRHAKNSRKSRK